MTILINPKPFELQGDSTLAEALTQAQIPLEGVAVAVNNRVVPRRDWDNTPLEEGSKITVIRAVCGG